MTLIERLFAATVLALCLAGLLRLCLPPLWGARVDARLRHARTWLARPWRRWQARRPSGGAAAPDADAARREAQAAIQRARTAARREGNVIHPERFRRPRRPH
jgi:hypothetical protein